MTFVVAHMMDSLSDRAVLHRPASMSLTDVKDEIVRAILAYLHSSCPALTGTDGYLRRQIVSDKLIRGPHFDLKMRRARHG